MLSLRGRCVVSLDGLRYEQSIDFTEELAQRGKGGKTHGRVMFSVSWAKLDSRMLTPGALVVTLRRGTNLAAADLGGTSDPYAKVRIGAQVNLGGSSLRRMKHLGEFSANDLRRMMCLGG